MKIIGIVGTVFGSKTKIALNHIKFSDDVEYKILDLADYDLEFADGRATNEYNESTNKLIDELADADGIIIGSPVYQASIPGSLKNLFDLLPVDTIRDKPVGIIMTSGSEKHYLVAEYQLIPILNYLKADVINKYIFVSQEHYHIDKISSPDIEFRMEQLVVDMTNRSKIYIEKMKAFDF